MNIIKITNTIAIGIPLILSIIGIFFNELIFFAALSTMLTGLIQVILGTFKLLESENKKYYVIYCLGVVIFFLLWYLNSRIDYNNTLTFILFPIPLLLCIYLSILIYKEK